MWNTIKTVIGYILLSLASVILVIFAIPIIASILLIIPPALLFGLIVCLFYKD